MNKSFTRVFPWVVAGLALVVGTVLALAALHRSDAQPPNEHGNYTVDYSGYLLVFDREGRLRLFIRPEATPQSVAHDMRLLLGQSRG